MKKVIIFIVIFIFLAEGFIYVGNRKREHISENGFKKQKFQSVDEYKKLYKNLIWNDEFDSEKLDSNKWCFEGHMVSKNNEMQSYADNLKDGNIEFNDGCIIIKSKKEKRYKKDYTSASILTQGKATFKYGIIEMRGKLPQRQGSWPAFWLIGQSNPVPPIPGLHIWPYTGETDIMESISLAENNNIVHGTVHTYNPSETDRVESRTGKFFLENGLFCDDFHTFGLIWNTQEMIWYVDDNIYYRADISAKQYASLRKHNAYIILNLAVGGNWPGSPNDPDYEDKYIIDYVRVYQ